MMFGFWTPEGWIIIRRSNELFISENINGTLTSVKSSGKWNISRTSSGVFPPMIRASAPQVRSTSGLNCRPRAAEANLQSFSVSIRTNFSSNDLRSCKLRKSLLRYVGEIIVQKKSSRKLQTVANLVWASRDLMKPTIVKNQTQACRINSFWEDNSMIFRWSCPIFHYFPTYHRTEHRNFLLHLLYGTIKALKPYISLQCLLEFTNKLELGPNQIYGSNFLPLISRKQKGQN